MALKTRVLGQSSAQAMESRPNTDLVTVATLVRGRVYFYKDEKFEVNVPKIISSELADVLEELHDTISDNEGEAFEKPFFHVQRNVPRPVDKTDPRAGKPVARRLPVRLPAHVSR